MFVLGAISVLVIVVQGHLTFDGQQFVQDVASVLCPFTDFCYTNASEVFSESMYGLTDRGFPSPCCHRCYCTDNCWELGNCCPDKQPLAVPPGVRPCLYSAASMDKVENIPSAKSYRVINDCPPTFNEETVRAKCNGTDRTELEDIIWVSDQNTGDIFQNTHCAVCHNITDFDVWHFGAKCRDALGSNFDSWKDVLIQSACTIVNLPPNNMTSFLQYECFETTDSNYFPCNRSGQWETYDYDIEYACALSTWPYEHRIYDKETMVAPNVFCRVCNEPDNKTIPSICYIDSDTKGRPTSGPGLSVLLDYNAIIADTMVAAPLTYSCRSNEVLDKFKGICREVLCSPGQAPFYGICKQFALGVNNLCVGVALQVQILAYSGDNSTENAETDHSLGNTLLERYQKRSNLIKPVCDISVISLHSSTARILEQDIVLWVSFLTKPGCQLGYIVNQTMSMIGKKIRISVENTGIRAEFANLDGRSQSKIGALPYIVRVRRSKRVDGCELPYRILRRNMCPRISLNFTEAFEMVKIAKKIEYSPLVDVLDHHDENDRVEICLEDYNFVMERMNTSVGNGKRFELIVLALLALSGLKTALI